MRKLSTFSAALMLAACQSTNYSNDSGYRQALDNCRESVGYVNLNQQQQYEKSLAEAKLSPQQRTQLRVEVAGGDLGRALALSSCMKRSGY